MKDILYKTFSYNGTMGRIDFLLYGLILPLAILFIFFILDQFIGNGTLLVGLLLAFYIAIVSALKRAHEASYSTTLLMILYIFLPYIGVLFLLFQGEPVRNKFYITEEK